MRYFLAVTTIVMALAPALANPIPLNQLNTTNLREHFARFLMREEAKTNLSQISTFAKLGSDGLSYQQKVLAWDYLPTRELTPDETKQVRLVAENLLIQGLGNFDGGLLADRDIQTILPTFRCMPAVSSPLPTPATQPAKPANSAPVAGVVVADCSGCGTVLYSGCGGCGTGVPVRIGCGPSVGTAQGFVYLVATAPAVTYSTTPEKLSNICNTGFETILAESINAYRGRNYEAALELNTLAIERKSNDPVAWAWRTAIEWQLGNVEAVNEAAYRAAACRVLANLEHEQLAMELELLQGEARKRITEAPLPRTSAEALALTSKPLPKRSSVLASTAQSR